MEKEIQKKQIEDMYNVVRDVLKNWWVILFIAISVSLLTYIGAAAGPLLVMIWTGILVVTRRTVRKESDIHRWMNTRCLGTVPEVHEKRRSRSTTMRMILIDAVVLAQYADGAAFVVRKDFARVDYIMDGMEHLAESNIQIIGGILNGV